MKLLFFDLETTGTNPGRNGIHQISGSIVIDGKHIQDFDFHVQPCRYFRAYDKFSFTENAFALCKGLSRDVIGVEKRIQFGLHYVENWTKTLGIDLSWHIKQKMRYNENRQILHGKKY